jgi:ribosomal protein S18 acetylase RimI-like enzyme
VTDPDVAIVSGWLDEVAATRLPYCLQLRPGAGPALAELATAKGMEHTHIPLMALEELGSLGPAGEVSGFSIHQISPEEAEVHARVLARGFELPPEGFLQLITPTLLSLPGVRCYVGEVEGQPVTTGLGASAGLSVGVFDIATPPEYRGRGYGAAVTVRAVVDAMEGGARWAWLQSSHEGYNLYRRLGFTDLEQWDLWVTAD